MRLSIWMIRGECAWRKSCGRRKGAGHALRTKRGRLPDPSAPHHLRRLEFQLFWKGGDALEIRTNLIGLHNLYNLASAGAAVLARGVRRTS